MTLKTKFYTVNQVRESGETGITPDGQPTFIDELITVHSAPLEVAEPIYDLVAQDLYLDNMLITFGEGAELVIIGGGNPIIEDFYAEAITNIVYDTIDLRLQIGYVMLETLVEYTG